MSTFLGFYLGKHDSNLAVSIDGEIKYRKSERYFGEKHHHANMSFIEKTLNDWGIDHLDGIAYSDGNRNDLGSCIGLFEEFNTFNLLNNPVKYCLDHHYAHSLSVWPVVDTDKVDVAISIDGNGDHYSKVKVFKNNVVLYDFKLPNVARILTLIGELMQLEGQQIDYAGKVMGLSSYGCSKNGFTNLLDKNLDFLVNQMTSSNDVFNFNNSNFVNSVSDIHASLENYTLELFSRFCNPNDVISYTGGCAQNSIINYLLINKYPNMHIPPHAYDGGISLGCLEFLRIKFQEEKFSKYGFPFWQDDKIESTPSENTIKKCASLIKDGKILGWMQGAGEIGPRALGNRSILFDPRNSNAKSILNSKIKFREEWRPYAGSILQEKALDYFDLDSSPYMLYAANCKNKLIPGVTHVDNTCRFQTVESGIFYNLIKEFDNLTGIPVLLNTSLNVAGKPIISTKDQALDLFNGNIDAICIGDELWTK